MHLLLFLSPDWLTFGHMFLSYEGPMLETLDYTIRIGSAPTFLYFSYNPVRSGLTWMEFSG